ncbi:Heat shock cognate 71 kDa protein [Lemmus lemmus]
MVRKAEKYKTGDEKQRDKKFQGKINDEDKQKILDMSDGIISCLDKNQTAEKERAEHWQRELEKVSNPIITKLYQRTGGMLGRMLGGFTGDVPLSGGTSLGPTIKEIKSVLEEMQHCSTGKHLKGPNLPSLWQS